MLRVRSSSRGGEAGTPPPPPSPTPHGCSTEEQATKDELLHTLLPPPHSHHLPPITPMAPPCLDIEHAPMGMAETHCLSILPLHTLSCAAVQQVSPHSD